jgi:hypothetical protein
MNVWRVAERGRYAGAVGLVAADGVDPHNNKLVQLQIGAGGPIVWMRLTSTRLATLAEIAEKMGCRVRDLPEELVEEQLDAMMGADQEIVGRT